MSLVLTIIGLLGLLYSLYYYISEIRCMPYSSMGVEMSFSHYWFVANAVFFSGLCLWIKVSVLWALLPTIFMYAISFRLRTWLAKTYMGLDCNVSQKESGFKVMDEKARKENAMKKNESESRD